MEFDYYIINTETLLIIPVGKGKSKVYETKESFIVNKSSRKIIEDSCLYFGSSYEGRIEGTKSLIGINMKVPIVVEDTQNIIFFPTASCIRENSIWVSFQNIVKYEKINDFSTAIYFGNNEKKIIGCKYCLVDSQYIRCIKLEKILLKRKSFIEKESFLLNLF